MPEDGQIAIFGYLIESPKKTEMIVTTAINTIEGLFQLVKKKGIDSMRFGIIQFGKISDKDKKLLSDAERKNFLLDILKKTDIVTIDKLVVGFRNPDRDRLLGKKLDELLAI